MEKSEIEPIDLEPPVCKDPFVEKDSQQQEYRPNRSKKRRRRWIDEDRWKNVRRSDSIDNVVADVREESLQ